MAEAFNGLLPLAGEEVNVTMEDDGSGFIIIFNSTRGILTDFHVFLLDFATLLFIRLHSVAPKIGKNLYEGIGIRECFQIFEILSCSNSRTIRAKLIL